MFKYVRRILAASGLGKASQARTASRSDVRISAGANPAVVTVATAAGARQTTASSEGPAVSSEFAVFEEPQSFLARLAATVPACLAAAWVDLAGREVLLFHGPEPAAAADVGPVGDAIADLFLGPNVKLIESLFRRSRGLAGDHTSYFKEFIIITDDCLGVFLRSESRADRALVVVTDKTTNLGMVIARARRLMTSADSLI